MWEDNEGVKEGQEKQCEKARKYIETHEVNQP